MSGLAGRIARHLFKGLLLIRQFKALFRAHCWQPVLGFTQPIERSSSDELMAQSIPEPYPCHLR